jgi:hypothetical protein
MNPTQIPFAAHGLLVNHVVRAKINPIGNPITQYATTVITPNAAVSRNPRSTPTLTVCKQSGNWNSAPNSNKKDATVTIAGSSLNKHTISRLNTTMHVAVISNIANTNKYDDKMADFTPALFRSPR